MAALNDNGVGVGLAGVDPELAVLLNNLTDDSNVAAVIVYHQRPTDADIAELQSIGVLGGTRYQMLPMISLTTTKARSESDFASGFRPIDLWKPHVQIGPRTGDTKCNGNRPRAAK